MVYYSPDITGLGTPLYTLNNQELFFIAQLSSVHTDSFMAGQPTPP